MKTVCPRCDGEGGWWHGHGGNETTELCTWCDGTGEIDGEGDE